jgi:hypothetical protein
MDVPGVSNSTASSMHPLPFHSSVDVQGVCVFFLNAEMPDCPASGQSGEEQLKMPTPEPLRYRNKGTHSGAKMLRYRTERPDAGMPVPVASLSMPMPSCEKQNTSQMDGFAQKRANKLVI